MCLLLGLSVGAAGWITQKRRPPAVITGEPRQYGMLRVAFPAGWGVTTRKGLPFTVYAEEPTSHGRVLRVTVEHRRGNRRTDADGLIARRSRGPQPGEPVTFLGEEGLLAEVRFQREPAPGGGGGDDDSDFDPAELFGRVSQGLLAGVVLEDGTGVLVSLEGESAVGPSNRKLIKRVLATMQRVPATQPATQESIKPAEQAASQRESL
jgi:hypothetical protein